MHLFLVDARCPCSWEGAWIYLGQNNLRMRSWAKNLSGTRISLGGLIQEEAENQRPHILDWIRCQREANQDSLDWWMSHLAGRNNAASQFFIYLIQIAALRCWIQEQEHDVGQVLVVCEDSFLLRAVRDNLQELAAVDVQRGWQAGWLYDSMRYGARALYSFLKQVRWFWSHAQMARKTRPQTLHPPQGEVYLIHQCLDDKAFLNPGPLSCRYFTVLPQWLEAQGRQVFRLPWLSNVNLPLDQVYHRLRASNCLIPEDWLTWRDYARALWSGFMSFAAIRQDITMDGFDLRALIERERCRQWGDGIASAMFWRYAAAIKRWGQNISTFVMYNHYEAMPNERVQIFAGRTKIAANTTFIGYYHSLVSHDFLAYHIPHGEPESQVFPDVIVTNGTLAYELLHKQGLPKERMVVGPALRQSFPNAQPAFSATEERSALLLPLSLIPDATIELLDRVVALAAWIRDHLHVPVLVKPHPMMPRQTILDQMGWTSLPDGWCWQDGEIYESLALSWCAITLNTAALVDVVLSGCIPCSLTRALDTPWNSLDFLADRFDVLQSVADDQLQRRLEEIFVTRREYFQSQTAAVQTCLLAGLNRTTDETLGQFL